LRRALALLTALAAAPAAWSQPAPAEAPATLALGQVLASVEQHFPLIDAAERDLDSSEGELLAADGAFDPQWRTRVFGSPAGYYQPLTADSTITLPTALWGTQLFAGWRYGLGLSSTGIPVYDGRIETGDYGELRAGATVPLWRNRSIDRARANVRRAPRGREAAELGVVQQRLDSTRVAAQRYWEWVAAGRRHAVARDLLALARDRDAGLAERVARGDLPEFERADNARALLQREGFVVQARRQLEQAAIELSLYLRDARGGPRIAGETESPADLPAPVSLDPSCLARESRLALARRPEPQRFAALRDREQVERDLQENQRRPAVDVSAAISQDIGPGPARLAPPSLEVGVVVEIPLLNRAATGRSRSASAAVARQETLRGFALDRVTADVRDTVSALAAARERTSLARGELALALDLAARERERLRLGDGTLLVLNLREVAAAEAAVREVDARLDWARSAVAYRFAVGRPQSVGVVCAVP